MANYQHYLSAAEKKAAGVESLTLKFPDAAVASALLAIAYALMGVAMAVAKKEFPKELWLRGAGYNRWMVARDRHRSPMGSPAEQNVTISLRGMSGRRAREIGEAIGRGIAEGMEGKGEANE